MKNRSIYLIILSALVLLSACNGYHKPDARTGERPRISPDYSDVTLPVNICPTNFRVEQRGDAYQVEFGRQGQEPAFRVNSRHASIDIPEDKWHDLLTQAAGHDIYFRVSIKQQGRWTLYRDITLTISKDSIDPVLVYRLIYPGYELWNEMGIYQRDLTSFRETAVLRNRDFSKQCVNCHSFASNSPENMMVHIRGKQGGTLIYKNGKVEKVNPKAEGMKNGAAYPAWSPDGRYIAFASNDIQQFFHAQGKKPIEVSDLAADLIVYDVEQHTTLLSPLVYGTPELETFPNWSSDGRTLYFTRSSNYRPGMALDSIRYDLCAVQVGKNLEMANVQTLFDAAAQGKSVSFPEASPDGRYLIFTLSDYGNFSIWHPESNLWLMDLKTGQARPLKEVNSTQADSYHKWSSSGRWFTFGSRRINGGWTRAYIAHFDPKTGRASKPFLLPQRNPRFYDDYMLSYNRPELVKAPIKCGKELLKAIPQEATQATAKRQ